MMRTRALLGAVVLAGSSAVGCTFCDTCDDFPIPVIGGAGMEVMGPPPMMAPPEGTYSPGEPGGPVVGEVAPPTEAPSPFAAPTEAAPVPEDGMEEPVVSPPAPDAPESSIPLRGTADESAPGSVPNPETVIPPSDAPVVPAPDAPEAP